MMAKKKALGIIISVLGMAALLTACQRQKGGRDINFPAYKVENPQGIFHYDQINETAGFSVNAELPKNWTIKKENGDEDVPPGELYTPVYIYEGDRLIGYIGFNIFEPYTEEIPQELYYQTVWPSLRLSKYTLKHCIGTCRQPADFIRVQFAVQMAFHISHYFIEVFCPLHTLGSFICQYTNFFCF